VFLLQKVYNHLILNSIIIIISKGPIQKVLQHNFMSMYIVKEGVYCLCICGQIILVCYKVCKNVVSLSKHLNCCMELGFDLVCFIDIPVGNYSHQSELLLVGSWVLCSTNMTCSRNNFLMIWDRTSIGNIIESDKIIIGTDRIIIGTSNLTWLGWWKEFLHQLCIVYHTVIKWKRLHK
jgi:hypothetical protein